jgi:hypothetical protein
MAISPEEYFASHSLNPDFLKKEFNISYDEDRITIPVYDLNGNFLSNRYRHLSSEPKFTGDKGSHSALFGINKAKDQNQVVLCEGEPDCMRLWQEGIASVTGTSGAKTFNIKLAEPLAGKKILLALDTDEAGQTAIPLYIKFLKEVKAEIEIIDLPKEFKDVCEYFTSGKTKDDFLNLPRISPDVWDEQHEPTEFKLETGEELIISDIPPEDWLIEHVLPVEGFCFIVGSEATGKSFYTLKLAESVTTGKSWLPEAMDDYGKAIFSVNKKVKVLFIDKENTRHRVQKRMRGLGMSGKDIWRIRFPASFDLYDPDEDDGYSRFAHHLSAKVKNLGIGLIIIDSFADLMVGNENAAGDVQSFFDAIRQLFPGICILVLHHSTKPTAGLIRTSSQMTRGSTNIMAQIYSSFYVAQVKGSKSEFTIEQTKSGDSEKLGKFRVGLITEPDPQNTSKTLVKDISYLGLAFDQDGKQSEAMDKIQEFFSDKIRAERDEIWEFCNANGITQTTFEHALKQLVKEKILSRQTNDSDRRKSDYLWADKEGEIYEE